MFFKNNFQKYGIILPIENLLSLILRAVKQRLTSLSIYTWGRHRWIYFQFYYFEETKIEMH